MFEAVRGRIVGADAFETEPSGAAGLAVLVKAHPTLQGELVDFLDALPRDRLGPWVCGGWKGVLGRRCRPADSIACSRRGAGKAEVMLKAAANGVLRTRRGRTLMGTSSSAKAAAPRSFQAGLATMARRRPRGVRHLTPAKRQTALPPMAPRLRLRPRRLSDLPSRRLPTPRGSRLPAIISRVSQARR